jgi:hypothetical protein
MEADISLFTLYLSSDVLVFFVAQDVEKEGG